MYNRDCRTTSAAELAAQDHPPFPLKSSKRDVVRAARPAALLPPLDRLRAHPVKETVVERTATYVTFARDDSQPLQVCPCELLIKFQVFRQFRMFIHETHLFPLSMMYGVTLLQLSALEPSLGINQILGPLCIVKRARELQYAFLIDF